MRPPPAAVNPDRETDRFPSAPSAATVCRSPPPRSLPMTADRREFLTAAGLTVAACQAGKDVYVEKPLTHDLSEGAAVVAAQNATKRVVQVGTQQRSMTHIVKAHELLKAGTIGQVHKVHCTWNRNAPRAQRF